jgi:iron complex transport system ATP-binding protein
MTSAISVNKLNHTFSGDPVLNNVSFDIAPGHFFIIIGPNGSGKTTLLKLLAGLLPIQTGRITLLERSLNAYKARELARRIAYVPQSVPIEFPFSVTEVVLMGRAPHLGLLGFEGPDDFERAEAAMAVTGVAHLARRRLDELSGGERQRVFIARALCQQPKVLLLDEPTAALDLAYQVRVMDMLERLKTEQGVTVVMVSHELNLAAMYADELLLLSQGSVASLGSPGQVLDFALLEKVYGCTLVVDQSPLGRYPRVHMVPGRHLKSKAQSPNDK